MFNLYNICLLRAFEHIHMEFVRYKCLLLLLLLLLLLCIQLCEWIPDTLYS